MEFNKILELNKIFAPTGEEKMASETFFHMIEDCNFNPEKDNFYNVWSKLGGTGEKVLICAPYDQKGITTMGALDQGGFYFSPIGSWDVSSLDGEIATMSNNKKVKISVRDDMKEYKPPYNYGLEAIDTNEKNKIRIADKAVFFAEDEITVQDNKELAQVSLLDSRAACYVLLQLLSEIDATKLNAEIYVAFVANDSFTLRGVTTLIKNICPDKVYTINCKAITDKNNERVLINHIGAKYISDSTLNKNIRQAAALVGLEITDTYERPASPSTVVDNADSIAPHGCRTLSLSIPVEKKDWRNGYVNRATLDKITEMLKIIITK